MTSLRAILALAALALLAGLRPALPQAQEGNPEKIEIGLSTDMIAITADFSGADLTIFGALDNADPLINRQGRYDVVVVLEGPARPVVVRRKDRVLGIWMNTTSETFVNVPASYSLATTRAMQDITDSNNYRQLSLGAEYIYVEPLDRAGDPETIAEFTRALRDRKKASGLYNERIGGVQFLSQNLFRASLTLAPNIPVGTHKARAFLFRNGVFLMETSAPLVIVKSGFEQWIHRTSIDYGLLYGIFAVGLAMVTGWVGRIVFRKD